ncbi:MAG TPA: hypothetical protein VN397_04650, partial [Candidatus Methylomirabilis sp.]|nr:hypothetical protein [Candidatus Methylomirabilis sp.]
MTIAKSGTPEAALRLLADMIDEHGGPAAFISLTNQECVSSTQSNEPTPSEERVNDEHKQPAAMPSQEAAAAPAETTSDVSTASAGAPVTGVTMVLGSIVSKLAIPFESGEDLDIPEERSATPVSQPARVAAEKNDDAIHRKATVVPTGDPDLAAPETKAAEEKRDEPEADAKAEIEADPHHEEPVVREGSEPRDVASGPQPPVVDPKISSALEIHMAESGFDQVQPQQGPSQLSADDLIGLAMEPKDVFSTPMTLGFETLKSPAFTRAAAREKTEYGVYVYTAELLWQFLVHHDMTRADEQNPVAQTAMDRARVVAVIELFARGEGLRYFGGALPDPKWRFRRDDIQRALSEIVTLMDLEEVPERKQALDASLEHAATWLRRNYELQDEAKQKAKPYTMAGRTPSGNTPSVPPPAATVEP